MTGFGIDLGTANTVVCHPHRGVVLDEPSVMVIRTSANRGRRIRSELVGQPAADLVGRCPVGMTAMRPFHDGVISDLETARAFVVGVLQRVSGSRLERVRPHAILGVPAGATPLERRALLEVADEAGIHHAQLIPEPIAGAVGCGLDPLEPRAHMVVDIGGGTSEITAFCYGGVVAHRSSRVAGDEMTLALHHYLRAEHQLLVAEDVAEQVKRRIDEGDGLSTVVQGVDVASGRPKLITLAAGEALDALRPTITAIITALSGALDDLPPHAADDVLAEGIIVFGGASTVRGFEKLLESAFAFPVHMADRPLTCVAEGAARCLTDSEITRAYDGAFAAVI